MASGHVNRIEKAEHMAAPTNAAHVKKALANPEPSTHGPEPTCGPPREMSAFLTRAAPRFAAAKLPQLVDVRATVGSQQAWNLFRPRSGS
jgi:hypothetical protein